MRRSLSSREAWMGRRNARRAGTLRAGTPCIIMYRTPAESGLLIFLPSSRVPAALTRSSTPAVVATLRILPASRISAAPAIESWSMMPTAASPAALARAAAAAGE